VKLHPSCFQEVFLILYQKTHRTAAGNRDAARQFLPAPRSGIIRCMETKNRIADTGFKPHVLLLWVCVAGTAAMLAAGAAGFFHYLGHRDEIAAKVVILRGAPPPAADADVKVVREWLGRFSAAMPNCKCSLGGSAARTADSALLFCVGFSAGPERCGTLPGKLPSGVSMETAPETDPGAYTKALFLFSRFASYDVIHPVTGRQLDAPGPRER